MVDADLISFEDLQRVIGSPARCTVYRWIKEGIFPAPLNIGPRRVAWRRSDIEGWLAARQPANRPADSPFAAPAVRGVKR